MEFGTSAQTHARRDSRFALHPWLNEFREPGVEAEFQRHHLDWSLAQLRTTLIICGVFYLGFFVTDVAALGWGREAFLLLGVRVLVAVTALVAVGLAMRHPQAMIGSGLAATVVEVVGMAAFLLIVHLRPNEMPWHGMSYGLMLVVVYVFIPNRFILSAGVAIASTLGFVLVGHLGGEINAVELLILSLLLLLANTFGLLASRRYHQLWRTEFQAQTELLASVRQLEMVGADALRATRQAEKASVEKSSFLAAASHDLRQPLQALKLFADSLGRTPLEPRQETLLNHLKASATALEDILNTLLDISRLESGAVRPQLQPVTVVELLDRVMEKMEPLVLERRLRCKLSYPRQDIWINTDATLLMSVLLNIFGNAVKYTERGGILIGVRRRGRELAIEVWDTGVGIDAEHLERVFDEFFQVGNPQRDREQGVGLGLSIARRICQLLGYRISCRSRPGRGSVFEIRIPASALTVAAPKPPDGAAEVSLVPVSLAGQRFVVLEDDALVATALRLWLEEHGASVRVHASAEAAMGDPRSLDADCYIADYQLAGDMSGVDFLDLLRQRRRRPIRAVLISGDTSGGFLRRIERSGWPFLIKPVSAGEVLARLAGEPD